MQVSGMVFLICTVFQGVLAWKMEVEGIEFPDESSGFMQS